jgi:uncharacterized membrane protein
MADAQRIKMMMDTAYQSMLDARSNRGKQIRRSIRRSWQYGGGKKKALKIAVGLGFGAIFVGVSIGTAGAGAPVIAALAVGSFMVGQMSDMGFAKLSGRKFRGKQKTNDWVAKFRSLNSDEQTEGLKATQERAHKTIRRAYEHFRRAVRKARAAQTATQEAAAERTCDAAAGMVMSTLHVSHHFDKARAYEFPAIFLCQTLLATYKKYLALWTDAEPKLRQRVGEILDGHAKDTPCDSDECFATGAVETIQAEPHPVFWSAAGIALMETDLKEVDDDLTAAGFDPAEPAPPGSRGAVHRAHELFIDAGRKYHIEHKRVHVKVKHGITNMWARKTTGERKARVASSAFSALVAAGGGAASGGMSATGIDPGAWAEVVQELAGQALELGGDPVIEKATEDEEMSGAAALEHHEDASRSGAESQTSLQKAAVHIYEIMTVLDKIKQGEKANDCASAVARLRDVYKVEHHLSKTQKYLGESIHKTVVLGRALKARIDASKTINQGVFKLAVEIVGRGDHSECGKVCYGPKGTASFMPARRLR